MGISSLQIRNDAIKVEFMKSDDSRTGLAVIFSFSVFIAISVIVLYFFIFRGGLSASQEVWGQFGDYMGGVLNPLLALMALLALLRTIVIQSEELKLSRTELSETRKEMQQARQQAVLTRVLTLSHNQASALREEVANLAFRVPTVHKGVTDLSFDEMVMQLHKFFNSFLVEAREDTSILMSLRNENKLVTQTLFKISAPGGEFNLLFNSIVRLFDANRFLIQSSDLSPSDSNDVKQIFFLEISNNLVPFLQTLSEILLKYNSVSDLDGAESPGYVGSTKRLSTTIEWAAAYIDLDFADEKTSKHEHPERRQKPVGE